MVKLLRFIVITVMFCLLFIYGSARVLAQGFPAIEVYQEAAPSVVLIISIAEGENIMGAGSVIASNTVLTNAHVVMDRKGGGEYKDIRVYLKPENVTGDVTRDLGRRYQAEIAALDADLDLALLDVQGLPEGVAHLGFADPGDIRVGEEVVAIGHPEQGGLWSLTYGRISGQISGQGGIKGKDVYQTDTSINRGNSGGPLLDSRSRIVGVNTNIARLGADNMPITGVNFALKSSVIRKWLEGEGVGIAYDGRTLRGESASPAAKAMSKTEEVIMEPETEAPKLHEDMPGEQPESDTILTPLRPYSRDELFKEVEKEMEDLMQEMKDKIKRR